MLIIFKEFKVCWTWSKGAIVNTKTTIKIKEEAEEMVVGIKVIMEEAEVVIVTLGIVIIRVGKIAIMEISSHNLQMLIS